MRVARARELVAEGDQATAAARIAQISRQAIYKTPQRRPPAAGPGRPGADDAAIVEIAKAHPTDGTRMVAAIASRQLGEPVNRKRAQRIMRTHRLLQPTRGLGRRRRPGYFRVRRPGRVVAYGHDQSLDSPARLGLPPRHRGLLHPRTRRMESRRAGPNRRGAGLCRHGDDPTVRGPGSVDDRDGQRNAVHLPTLPQPTRRTWDRPSERRIPRSRVSGVHRVMVGRFKKRVAWRAEWETIDQARRDIANYVNEYHRRPHSGLAYRTPAEVAHTWRTLNNQAT